MRAVTPTAAGPADTAADTTGEARGPDSGSATGQGPTAEGTIVFSQDFEQDFAGLTPSPTSIPTSRYQRVDDPLGQRGKVMRIVWQAGDTYKTSPNNKPRSAISNTGYHYPFGSKVSYAWGYMITSLDINATFAQHIRPGGPMWMLEGHNEGDLIVRCGGHHPSGQAAGDQPLVRLPGGGRLHAATGTSRCTSTAQKVYERTDNLGFTAPKNGDAHWDGGIYNTELGISNNRTRTVYISNLSIGRK